MDATNTCYACGRPLDDTSELTLTQKRVHLRIQDNKGFRNRGQIVHFTEAEYLAKSEALRRRTERARKWYGLEKRLRQSYPELSWLVLLGISYFEEGNYAAGADALHSFRRELRALAAARIEALADYRAEMWDAMRPAA